MVHLPDDCAPGGDARQLPLPGKCNKRMSLGAYLLDALQAEDVHRHTSNERNLLVLFTHTQPLPKGVRLILCARNGLDGLVLYGTRS